MIVYSPTPWRLAVARQVLRFGHWFYPREWIMDPISSLAWWIRGPNHRRERE